MGNDLVIADGDSHSEPATTTNSPVLWSPTRLVQVAYASKVASDLIRFERNVEQFVHVLSKHHVAVDEDQSLGGGPGQAKFGLDFLDRRS